MKLIRTEDAVGHVLCHDITQIIKGVTKDAVFRKGHIVTEEDIPVLLSVGKEHLYVWEKQEGMLHENEAAEILREISRFLDFYPRIEPAMGITYSRTAWVGVEDPRLRITFDSDIQWRETELRLDREAGGEALLPPGGRLMEIKVPGAMPLWLARLLEEEAVYPASFSKYGRAYRQARFGKNKEGIICA